MYLVPAGTQVHVRVTGSPLWVEYVTTRDCHFYSRTSVSNGGFWVLEKDGWEMRVLPSRVIHRPMKKKKNNYDTFNKCILGRNGRGASRRRNRR